jgi:hypothetical protein
LYSYSRTENLSLKTYKGRQAAIIRHVVVAVVAVFVISLVVGLTASTVGAVSEVGTEGQYLTLEDDLSYVPQSVLDDARSLSLELLGKNDDNFVNELLSSFIKSSDKDLVIFFNPGGWGYNVLEQTPGWQSILAGIQSELGIADINSLVLTYQRTVNSIQGHLGELVEMVRGYSSKAKSLAQRIQFLTTHNPHLKVVIAAESMGTLISSKVMEILADNDQVFSIQTGQPPWDRHDSDAKTLVINDNGDIPDSFSEGNIPVIIKANLEKLLLLRRDEDDNGQILGNVAAPGHDYAWYYPLISSEVSLFLDQNVGLPIYGR